MERLGVLLGHLGIETEERTEIAQYLQFQTVSGETTEEYDPVSQHGGLIVGKALANAGVKYVFTLAGGHISPILVGCKRQGIRVIDVRDEATAAFAADATSRLTGVPGVAIVTAGPGLTNTITAVKNSQMAESTLIIMGGATAMLLKGRGSLQDIDQAALMSPHVKRVELITKVEDIWSKLETGFEVALSGTPGPVFFEFPLEVLYPQAMMQAQLFGSSPRPQGFPFSASQLQARLQDWYLSRHVKNTYGSGAAHGKAATSSFKYQIHRINVHSSDIKAAFEALRRSKSAVFILGSQAVRMGETDQVIHALETIGAPVFLSGMARGLLGVSHPLLMRHNRKQALQQADCIFVVGVSVDFRLNYGRHIGKNAYFAMVNYNAEALQKNADIRSRNLSVFSDPIYFMRDLCAHWKASNTLTKKFSDWIDTCRASDDRREAEINNLISSSEFASSSSSSSSSSSPSSSSSSSPEGGINPLYLFKLLNQYIDDESVIVADGGDFVGTASYTLFPRKPLSWLDPGAFGTLGVGGGMAIAAKLARPNAEVWLIYGDGSSAYSLAEIDTCVRHHLPVIAVIGNDAAWMQILRDQVVVLGDDVGCTLKPCTRYDIVSKGYGGEGILVSNHSEILPSILTAKQLAKQGIPVVLNCLLQKSSFREGSLSV